MHSTVVALARGYFFASSCRCLLGRQPATACCAVCARLTHNCRPLLSSYFVQAPSTVNYLADAFFVASFTKQCQHHHTPTLRLTNSAPHNASNSALLTLKPLPNASSHTHSPRLSTRPPAGTPSISPPVRSPLLCRLLLASTMRSS